MHDVFISYSRRDTEVMARVSQYLREAGLSVWTDEGIEPGTLSWKQSLSDAILDCKFVIVLFSPHAVESTWIHRELDFAELHGKKLYPLLVAGEPADSIPFGYTTYQFIDIRSESHFNDGLVKLRQSLNPDENRSTPPAVTLASQQNLWQWIEADRVQMTIPHTWKQHEPTSENIQKLQILMMGKDETLFYRAIEDFNSNFIKQATGSPFGKMNSLCTLSSISDLSPVVGFLAEYRNPFVIPGRLTPGIMGLFKKRIMKFMQTRYRAELSEFQWIKSATGRIWTYQWKIQAVLDDTQAMTGQAYTIFPAMARRSLFLSLICESSQFAKQVKNFEQLARSIQFVDN